MNALTGLFLVVALLAADPAQSPPDDQGLRGDYLGQPPPGAVPEVFALGIVSTADGNEHGAPAFSPDGNEVFWWANQLPDGVGYRSMTARRESNRWSAPQASPLGEMLAFAPDGRRVFFASQDDIWVADKQGDGWGEPKSLDLLGRSPELRHVYMPTVARNGTLYFLAYLPGPRNDFGIFRAELVDGEYAEPQALPRSINLPPFVNWAPFIAPDESYLLFSSNRHDPDRDAGDIYISHRQADGGWTEPTTLGEVVNTPRQEVFPGLSPDGRYLFFCRDTPDRKNDVYWVAAATIPALGSVPAPQQR